MRWDIFCKVIDNHGDIGVCWRLSAELARRGEQARLWVDDASALAWMAPGGQPGVEVRAWTQPVAGVEPGDVVVEAFGCELDAPFMAAIAEVTRTRGHQPAWLNLEYLSAEAYVERCHGLPSPVMSGPARDLVKRFFYPGFTPRTGGLIRENDLPARQAAFDRHAWLQRMQLPVIEGEQLVSLFCYEPAALPQLLTRLAQGPQRTRLLVAAGRPQKAVQQALSSQKGLEPAWNMNSLLSISYLPLMPQSEYDHLLWTCDLNFVRGEDSLVRALWAGRPFVWQIYPQDDGAHHAKLGAFLDWLAAPASWRAFHEGWNAPAATPLPPPDLAAWGHAACSARARLQAQQDLVTQLLAAAHQPPDTAALP